MYPCVWLSVYPPVYLLPIHPSIHSSIDLSLHRSIDRSIHTWIKSLPKQSLLRPIRPDRPPVVPNRTLFVCVGSPWVGSRSLYDLSINLPTYLSICLSIYLSTYLSTYLSIYLSLSVSPPGGVHPAYRTVTRPSVFGVGMTLSCF